MSFANFVQAQLAEPLAIDGVSITLAPAVAPNQLPPVDGGVMILADSLGKPTFVEIISYTSRAGQTLNGVTRAQEGTVARVWPAGSQCYQSLTAGEFKKISALETVSSNITAQPYGQYWLAASVEVNLPSVVGLVPGTTVRFSKALDATPTIVSQGTLIRTVKGSDYEVLFDVNAELVFVFNGTEWEI